MGQVICCRKTAVQVLAALVCIFKPYRHPHSLVLLVLLGQPQMQVGRCLFDWWAPVWRETPSALIGYMKLLAV